MLHHMDTIKRNKLYFIIAEKEIVLDFFFVCEIKLTVFLYHDYLKNIH